MREEKALKVGFRVGRYPSLTETFIAGQIRGLAANGHEVAVLADCPEHPESSDTPARPASGLRYVWPRQRLLSRLVQKAPYRFRRRVSVAAERLCCQQNDVVVCNFGWAGAAVAASVAGRPRRARLVTLFHGDDMSRSVVHGGRGLYRQLFEEADLLLPVSEHWRRRLAEWGAPAGKLLVHHMGVDPQRFAYSVRDRRPGQTFELVTLGRLVEKKGTETTLRALAHLRRHSPRLAFRFRVYGDGPLRADLLALCHRLGIEDVVDFAGPLQHDRVGEVFATADAFVLPSVTAADGDMEGIPIVLMEAMASGVPVIATRHSGIPELIEHGVNGLLIAERDAPALARHIAALAADPACCRGLAEEARRTVERDFNSRRQNDRLESLLRDLVASSPDRSPLPRAALREA